MLYDFFYFRYYLQLFHQKKLHFLRYYALSIDVGYIAIFIDYVQHNDYNVGNIEAYPGEQVCCADLTHKNNGVYFDAAQKSTIMLKLEADITEKLKTE